MQDEKSCYMMLSYFNTRNQESTAAKSETETNQKLEFNQLLNNKQKSKNQGYQPFTKIQPFFISISSINSFQSYFNISFTFEPKLTNLYFEENENRPTAFHQLSACHKNYQRIQSDFKSYDMAQLHGLVQEQEVLQKSDYNALYLRKAKKRSDQPSQSANFQLRSCLQKQLKQQRKKIKQDRQMGSWVDRFKFLHLTLC